MKILYVLHSFSPQDNRGAEIAAHREMREDLRQGHEVSVFFRRYHPEKTLYEIEEGVHREMDTYAINANYPNDQGFKIRYLNSEIENKFRGLIERLKPDKVVFHHVLGLSMNLPMITKEKGIPSTFMLHDSWGLCDQIQMLNRDLSVCHKVNWIKCSFCRAPQLKSSLACHILERLKKMGKWTYLPWFNCVLRFVNRFCAGMLALQHFHLKKEILNRFDCFKSMILAVDHCFVPSLSLKRLFVEHGFDESMLLLKENEELKVQNFSRPKKKPLDEIFTLGFVGSIIPAKGLHILLRAIKKLKKIQLRLIVYGSFHESEEFPFYRQFVQEAMKDSRVRFAGSFQEEDVTKVYSSFDCLVVPSIWRENAPLVIGEAQKLGVAVIASNIGGIPENLVKDSQSFLFKAGSASSLAHAIIQMMEKKKIEYANN